MKRQCFELEFGALGVEGFVGRYDVYEYARNSFLTYLSIALTVLGVKGATLDLNEKGILEFGYNQILSSVLKFKKRKYYLKNMDETHLCERIEMMAIQATKRRDKYLEIMISCENKYFPMMYEKYKQSKDDYKACMHVVSIFKRNDIPGK